jgi:drug/metabolite transporter (DMT)-like permease
VPVYTAIFGSVLLGEQLAVFHVIGFVLILAGVWLASRPVS